MASEFKKDDYYWIDEQRKAHPYSEYDDECFSEEFGGMLDYAVNYVHYDPEEFLAAFMQSKIPSYIEFGDSKYAGGMCGSELCCEIEEKVLHVDLKDRPLTQFSGFCFTKGKDYWVGFMIAHYQWHSNLTFKEIFDKVSVKKFYEYYEIYHQQDKAVFMEELDKIFFHGVEKEDFHWFDENGVEHPYSSFVVKYFPNKFGCMIEYAVNHVHYDPEEFLAAFMQSELPFYIEIGASKYVSEMNCVRMCLEIESKVFSLDISDKIYKIEVIKPDINFTKGKDYWVGFMIAYFQWHSNLKFKEIFDKVPVKKFYEYYERYHREDKSIFMEELDRVCLQGASAI